MRLLEEDLKERPWATHSQRAEDLFALCGVRVSEATVSWSACWPPPCGPVKSWCDGQPRRPPAEEGKGTDRGEGMGAFVSAGLLCAYSADLNPIEEAFSKVKHILRKIGARGKEALIEAMGRALEAVSAQDVLGFFAHCGYRTLAQQL